MRANDHKLDVIARALMYSALHGWTVIVAQASNYEEPTTIKCPRRPGPGGAANRE
jgi:hypothetical protein